MLLEVDKLNTFYGNLHAIWDISIEVGEGEIVALIGSNGAGKSTLLKPLAGSVPMRSGEIRYQGRTLAPSQMKANHLVREGIILCPEGRHIFPRMPVEENLRIGGYTRPKEELKQSYVYMSCFRGSRIADSRLRARSLAANSRCWRLAAP